VTNDKSIFTFRSIFISGELYVEDLGERRTVSIRMGWLWVEGTPMRLPLRALNLRQAPPSLCQPHTFALGFTLSNSQSRSLATFWVIINTKLSLNLFPPFKLANFVGNSVTLEVTNLSKGNSSSFSIPDQRNDSRARDAFARAFAIWHDSTDRTGRFKHSFLASVGGNRKA